MRVGIDATCWANPRGYGRFTRELVTALAPLAARHDLVCFLDERSAAVFDLDRPNVQPVRVHQRVAPTLAAATGRQRSPVDMLRLSNAVRRASLDVFFSPSVYAFFPLPPGLPAVVTVHDAIAEQFPALTLPSLRDRLFWRLKVGLAIRQARIVLTVSEYAAGQVARFLGVPESRMRVTLEGVAAEYRPSDSAADIDAARARAGLPADARWLIYVGGFNPHKHVDVLVRAHAAVAARHRDRPLGLVLAGAQGDGFHDDVAGIRRAIRECGTESLVAWTGYLPDAELRHLHSGALALVLPSASEGFGLPAVEAARCGAPVIATTESPLPRLLAGGGLFVAPGNQAALEAAIERLATDEAFRLDLGREARRQAEALSWTRSAQVVLDAIEEAAAPLGARRVS
jgi:glycosyltransferase involved in cell wall biosynthesis